MRDTVEFVIGTGVRCSDQSCGTIAFVIVDPLARQLTHLIVKPEEPDEPSRLVPVGLARLTPEGFALRCRKAEFDAMEPAEETHFLHGVEGDWGYRTDQVLAWPFFGLGPGGAGIAAAEPPMVTAAEIRYRVPPGEVMVRRGERIHAVDGAIGKVRGLVVDRADGMVTHVLLDEGHLWGRKHVAIPIRSVAGIDDEGVAVTLTKDEIKDLPPVDIEGLDPPGDSVGSG